MDEQQRRAVGVSYAPCPAEEFCGRGAERENLRAVLSQAGEQGQRIMISGPPGVGKSSLLNWFAGEILEYPAGSQSLVLRGEVFDLPGMIFSAFRELLKDLRRYMISGRFQGILGSEGMKEAVRYTDDLLEKYAAPVEPVGLLSKTGEEIIGVFARLPEVRYDQVRQAFEELLQELGRLMIGSGCIAAILLDDVHLASRFDRQLIRDTMRNLPPGIVLAFTGAVDGEGDPGYATVRDAIQDTGLLEIPLSGMRGHEIQEMGRRRFGLSLSDATAGLLERDSGDPFSLMACFNTLRHRGLAPSSDTIAALLAGAESPAGLAFAQLPGSWKAWAEKLAVLYPPFPVPVMACMLGLQKKTGVTEMMDQLQEIPIFRRLPGGEYAFAHPLLQDHCRRVLSRDAKIDLNARAADCFERSMHRLPGRLHVLLSLACHFFNAGDHQKAADLNLELGLRFYRREDYDTALVLTERAITSAERLGDAALLTAGENQRDLVRQKIRGPVQPGQ